VVAFTDRDADTVVADGLDRVNEQPQPLIQRCRSLDVDQRSMQRLIVIPVTKKRADAPRQRRRQRLQQRYFLRGPAFLGGGRL
jgi:hypothetical protein